MTDPRIFVGAAPCDFLGCEHLSAHGAIFTMQPNGMRPTHAVYYWCAAHDHLADGALNTWGTSGSEVSS